MSRAKAFVYGLVMLGCFLSVAYVDDPADYVLYEDRGCTTDLECCTMYPDVDPEFCFGVKEEVANAKFH